MGEARERALPGEKVTMGPTYVIVDEPRRSSLAHLAVRPYFPLLALMLGGAWIGWPWFAINAFALGSATRVKDTVLCTAAVIGSAAMVITLGTLHVLGVLGNGALPYSWLAITVWKLGVGYWLYESQQRTAALREHFGPTLRNGLGVVIVSALVRTALLTKVSGLGIGLLTLVMD
jgi:hypothetical protein